MPNVRPTLVTLEEIDTAWAALFAGINITLLDGGSTAVPVNLEENIPVEQKQFPYLGIELLGEFENFESHEASWYQYTESTDSSTPPVATVKNIPENVRLIYQIKAWVVNDTQGMRELIQDVRSKLGRRMYLSIPKVDPVNDVERDLWVFQEGEMDLVKIMDNDELVMQAVWVYSVLAELDRGGETTIKTVTHTEFGIWQGVNKDTKFRSVEYDGTDYTPKA